MKLIEKKAILDEWYSQFKDIPKLPIKEAQILTKKMNLAESEVEQKHMRETLITGTMNAIYGFIKHSGLLLINNSAYGIEDIIGAACELWIKKLDEGVLLENIVYARCFSQKFYRDLAIRLGAKNTTIYDLCKLSGVIFNELLEWYIKERFSEKNPTKDEIYKYLKENYKNIKEFEKENGSLERLYFFLYKIYEINFKNQDGFDFISKNKLLLLEPLLLDSVISTTIYNNNLSNQNEDVILQNIMFDELRKDIFESNLLSLEQRELIISRYGFEEEKTLNEIGIMYGLSGRTSAKYRQNAILKILRRSNYFCKKYKNYDE